MRVLVDRRREVLVRGQHAAGREQCGGREGVEGCTHSWPWVLDAAAARLLRPSMRPRRRRWAAVALRCTILLPCTQPKLFDSSVLQTASTIFPTASCLLLLLTLDSKAEPKTASRFGRCCLAVSRFGMVL